MTHYFQLACWISIGAAAAVALAGCDRQVNLGPVADAATVEAIRTALTKSDASAEDGEAAAAATGTGWATIRGQFVFDGPPPERNPYNVTKEHSICSINGKPPLQETLVVDSASNGIKNVVIFLREASRVHESAGPQSDPIEFDQKQCVFLTHVMGVTIGETIELKNSDPTGHNTKIGGKNTFNQTIPAGQAIPFKPQKEEALPTQVTCSIHEWMVAYMLPRANGYHAVTDDEGRFEIANVPAGETLEFQVWHESGAAGGGLVGNTPEDAGLKWSKRGRVTITLEPDEVKEVKVIVPAGAFRG